MMEVGESGMMTSGMAGWASTVGASDADTGLDCKRGTSPSRGTGL